MYRRHDFCQLWIIFVVYQCCFKDSIRFIQLKPRVMNSRELNALMRCKLDKTKGLCKPELLHGGQWGTSDMPAGSTFVLGADVSPTYVSSLVATQSSTAD